jgi:integrase
MRGHVRKRGNTYSIVYDERPDPTSGERRQRERGGYATREEAEDALALAIAAVRSGGYVEPSKVTVARFLTDWIERKAQDDLEPSTATSYRQKINLYLIPRLGPLRVQELDIATIEDALRTIHREGGHKGRPLSLRTVRYCRFILSAALEEAQRRGIRADNPAQLTRVPNREHPDWQPRSAPQQPWSLDELRRFLAVATEDRLAAMWITYVRSGARRGELLALTWTNDVDLEAGTLEVRRSRIAVQTDHGRRVYDKAKPKSLSSRRTITLDAHNVHVLKVHRRQQAAERLAAGVAWIDEDRVFCQEDGTGLDPDRISAQFTELCDKAKVRRVRLHDTRHGMATLMICAELHLMHHNGGCATVVWR